MGEQLTPDEQADVDAAVEAVTQYGRDTEALTEKYVGKAALAFGRSIENAYSKKSWIMAQVYDLGVQAGHANRSGRRCRNWEGETYKQYERVERECERVAHHLMQELLGL